VAFSANLILSNSDPHTTVDRIFSFVNNSKIVIGLNKDIIFRYKEKLKEKLYNTYHQKWTKYMSFERARAFIGLTVRSRDMGSESTKLIGGPSSILG